MESIAAFCKGKTTLARYSAKPVSPGRAAVSALLGLLAGAVNGLLGAGGGMLAVPLLTGAEGLPAKKAHATAIALILPLSAVSTLVYALTGGGSYAAEMPAAAGVFAGGIVGALLLSKAPAALLTELFYGVMMFAGIKMLFGA